MLVLVVVSLGFKCTVGDVNGGANGGGFRSLVTTLKIPLICFPVSLLVMKSGKGGGDIIAGGGGTLARIFAMKSNGEGGDWVVPDEAVSSLACEGSLELALFLLLLLLMEGAAREENPLIKDSTPRATLDMTSADYV
jgi:hypothetical protein